MKKLVIFDLDGTLLDTSKDLMNSMNGMLTAFGYENISLKQTKEYIGNGAKNFVLRSITDKHADNIDACLKKYNEIYNSSGSPETSLYIGMDGVLRSLKNAGAAIAIVSNKPQTSTDEVYSKYLSEFDFDFVYGNRQGFAHKPDKECGEYVLEQLGIDRNDDVIVVGDGETDVKFACNLGCKCVAVTWGYRSREVLELAGGKIFADTVEQLKEILLKFINNEDK